MHFTLVGKYRWHSAFFTPGEQVLICLCHICNDIADPLIPRDGALRVPSSSEMEVHDETCCTCKTSAQ